MDASLDAMAADVLGLMDGLQWSSVAVLGHSMGARVAIRAAAHDPRRIGKLLLIDPPMSGPGRRAYPVPLSWYVESIRLATRGVTAEELRPYAPTWKEEHLQLRAEWLHTCSEEAIVQAHAGFHEDDIHADLPKLRPPGLLMTAGKGGIVLPEDLAEIEVLAPDLKQCEACAAGHMIPWDDEVDFHRLLGEYLKVDLL
jgi:N-formylmaleamate deformylase